MPLPTWQFEDILRSYDRTRQRNHAIHLERQEEVYQRIPAIKEIDQRITARSIQTGRQLLFKKEPQALQQLHVDNLELSMQKVELLVSNGYAPDYLAPIYDCPACKDTGYIDGKKCTCLKKAIIHRVYHQSSIQEKLNEENFQTFSYEYYDDTPMHPNLPSPRQNMISIVEKCMDFIQTFHTNPGQNILFQGDVGVGKTFLTNCIAKELIDESYTVIYLTSFQLVEILENHRFHRNETPDTLYTMDYVLHCDLLIIDDLGTELLNDLVTSQLFLCINERLLGKRSTIISTNLSLSQLTDAYSERIVSRITENYLICKIYGDDIRLKKSFTN